MNPVLVNVFRGKEIESVHRGCYAVVDATGKLIASAGDIHATHFPRSALKLIQALALIESGAADALEVDEHFVCFACASHNGEEVHHLAANAWLSKLDLFEYHLECGEAWPMHTQTLIEWAAHGGRARKPIHNCSGKHSSMLAQCKHLGHPVAGYSHYDHPVQQSWLKTLGELAQLDASELPWDHDGCGLPAVALPLERMAFAMAQFTPHSRVSDARKQAMTRILDAINRHPYLIAGKDRLCSVIPAASGGRIIAKIGAEGYYIAVIPELGYAVALKIDDGAERAAEAAMHGVMHKLGLLDWFDHEEIDKQWRKPIINSKKRQVGLIEAAFDQF